MERTIALTGATGFLGQAVVERLLEEPSLKLRCLVREGRNPKGLDERGPRVEIVPGDVCAPKTLGPLLEGAWGVINLAGLRGFWASATKDYYDLNERGAAAVFRSALDHDCEKVVQVSTPLAFGMPERSPFDETDPPGPHASDYARSKHLGDEAGWQLHHGAGLPFTVVHLAAVIGAGDPQSTMEVRRAAKGRLPALVGADTTFTYVALRDAAEAIVQALLRPHTVGRCYLVGRERATTREYFDIISDLAKVPAPNWNIPEGWILPWARWGERVARWTGTTPWVPADVVATSAAGSLIFDAKKSEVELGLVYTPLREALAEAVAEIMGDRDNA